MTQVEFERSFSTLKFVKSRLRSNITQEHLEELMLMYMEKQLVNEIPVDEIIDLMANSSPELRRLLLP